MLASFRWPGSLVVEGLVWERPNTAALAAGDLVTPDHEAQGHCYLDDRLFVVTRNSILQFSTSDLRRPLRARQHLTDVNATTRPCHLSAPTIYKTIDKNYLFVPAGGVPNDASAGGQPCARWADIALA